MALSRRLHFNLLPNTNLLHNGLGAYHQARGTTSGNPEAIMDLYLEYAALAEAGNFTTFFLADTPGAAGAPIADAGSPEPITALATVAAATKNLGLIGTMSTTFYDPYNMARLVGSLDLVSDGRAGVNAVTSGVPIAAQNYSQEELSDRETRYERADEFLSVLKELFGNRRVKRNDFGNLQLFADPINFSGKYFSIRGPLNVAPSRQDSPLISQAGASGPGIRLGARHADIIFTNANTKEGAAQYRKELNSALTEAGREPDSVPVLPGITPFLAQTAREAHELKDAVDAELDHAALAPHVLKGFGLSFDYEDLDEPFPVASLPRPEEVMTKIHSAYGNYVGLFTWVQANPGVTVRQLVSHTAGGFSHRKFVGSYDQFTEELIDWFDTGSVEGFTIIPAMGLPSLRAVVEEIVPRLIDRGLYRSEPDDRPLRQRFTS